MKKATTRTGLYMFRCSKNLTQEKFAERIGYKRDTYAKVENGDREPSVKFMRAIAQAWAIPLSEVFELLNIK